LSRIPVERTFINPGPSRYAGKGSELFEQTAISETTLGKEMTMIREMAARGVVAAILMGIAATASVAAC
jgi:hypothetical protein